MWIVASVSVLLVLLCPASVSAQPPDLIEMPAATLRDKIRGGLLGQILGNLNGLEHEMEYIHEPGNVTEYVPALPDGAWTDDDTDFEWVYIVAMQRENEVYLPPERIAKLWRERINRRIWCSNRYARHLMDLGIDPPLTGNVALNPWADFNISGQFICETFGLLAPAMPQTAARIGLNYTTVTIDREPAQTTQFFTSMIATAFVESEVDAIIDAGVEALAPTSQIREITTQVRQWHKLHPDDWRATRRLMRDKYTQDGGGMRDRNGYELNTAATIAALLYGGGDFTRTLLIAFNFGWDCDNTAASAGTIIGTVKGYRWMMAQGWRIVDRYENRTREQMPMDETITSFADRLVEIAERVIREQGGERAIIGGQPVYRVRRQKPVSLIALASPEEQLRDMRRRFEPEIAAAFDGSADRQSLARAAYLAIALDLFRTYQKDEPERWNEATRALEEYWRIPQNIYHDADVPLIHSLRERAAAAGLKKPAEKRKVW
jgi:ADP-ribosylglycohydrolase